VLDIEALNLLLIVLYVIDAVVVCDPGTTQIVGWEPGIARLRKGLHHGRSSPCRDDPRPNPQM
jgi:hypothetical protein